MSVPHPVPRRYGEPTAFHSMPVPKNPTASASCTLPAETCAVARARAFARDRLAAWHLGEESAEAAGVVVSEFVTNSVRHSGAQDVTLRLARCMSHLWIEVVDTGVWRSPTGSEENGLAEGGRGIRLVDALSQRSGVHRTQHGTHAWALLPDAPATCRRPDRSLAGYPSSWRGRRGGWAVRLPCGGGGNVETGLFSGFSAFRAG
ncbi:ATP-binding protein [Streptomyces sp. NRRL S-474]|uniref:ATP-binding protein n=1 Tax=Streptomyces sp. NRRL S-474 TaxID=1463909 RepID=UPI003B6415D3